MSIVLHGGSGREPLLPQLQRAWHISFSRSWPSRGFYKSITYRISFGLAGVILMLAFAAYAFHTSLGGRPMLQTRLLEE